MVVACERVDLARRLREGGVVAVDEMDEVGVEAGRLFVEYFRSGAEKVYSRSLILPHMVCVK